MINSDKLNKSKLLVKQYEKEISVKQEEIKNITRNMSSENYKIDDIKKFLNSGPAFETKKDLSLKVVFI